MVAMAWDYLGEMCSGSCVYFDKTSLVSFIPNCGFTYTGDLCPIRPAIRTEAVELYENEASYLGTAEVGFIALGLMSRPVIPPSMGAVSAESVVSSVLASAAVTVYCSLSQSAPVPMVPTTVAVSSAAPPGQPSLPVGEDSLVPQLPLHGGTVLEDLQGPVDFTHEQCEAVSHLVALHLSDWENLRYDYAESSVTIPGRCLAVAGLRTKNSQLRN